MKTYQLPEINFNSSVVPGVMSRDQLMTHYIEHHGVYIDKVNRFLDKESLRLEGTMLEYLSSRGVHDYVADLESGPVYNNVAQAWNHTFFWISLGLVDTGKFQRESGDSSKGQKAESKQVIHSFRESREKLKSSYKSALEALWGSGYLWVVWDLKNEFNIQHTANATPALGTQSLPLLAIDLWEHAYYLMYQNDRTEFASRVWDNLNWEWAESLVSDPGTIQLVEDAMKKN